MMLMSKGDRFDKSMKKYDLEFAKYEKEAKRIAA